MDRNHGIIENINSGVTATARQMERNIHTVQRNYEREENLDDAIAGLRDRVQDDFLGGARDLAHSERRWALRGYKLLSAVSGTASTLALPFSLGFSIFGYIPTGVWAFRAWQLRPSGEYTPLRG